MTGSSLALAMLVGLVALALAFDFLNGLHDAANSIATVVSTRVLRPFTAVIWAAFFNFVAIVVFGLHVAQTLGTGIIDAGAVNESVIFGALVGAIVWNIASWLLAFPTSSGTVAKLGVRRPPPVAGVGGWAGGNFSPTRGA